MQEKKLIVILGPTASGKTAMAIELAQKLNCEIISADSRQFYKEISIGTAKPSNEELEKVNHHFINSISINDDYNAGKFETDALKCISELHKKNNYVIMAGGSGMYINAVCNGFDVLPEANEETRNYLSNLFKEKGIEGLQTMLREKDPDHYSGMADRQNPHRLIRALEVCIVTEKPYSSFRSNTPVKRAFEIRKYGIDIDRTKLYERINQRVDQMIESGLIDEAKRVYPLRQLNSLNTVGYKELFDHFEGKHSLEKAIDLIKQNTRHFAKRQLTWFRKDTEIKWIKSIEDFSIQSSVPSTYSK